MYVYMYICIDGLLFRCFGNLGVYIHVLYMHSYGFFKAGSRYTHVCMNVTLYGMVTVPGVAGIAFAEGFL